MALFRDAAVALVLTAALSGSAGAQPAPPGQAASSEPLIAVCVTGDIWTDGDFEATNVTTLANPNYVSTSVQFGRPDNPNGTPLCHILNPSCMDEVNTPPALNGPNTGKSWAWFGGNDGIPTPIAEIASVQQTVTIPDFSSSATLSFYLRNGLVTAPYTDTLDVQVDGITQQTFTELGTAETTYTKRSINLSAFADGAAHVVKFLYTQRDVVGVANKANFDVDDVTLDIVCGAPVAAAQLSVDPIALGGNGVLEPGETVVVAPGYTNLSASLLPLTGTASNFTGPGSPTDYTLNDLAADYGSIAASATNNCFGATGDCYAMTVSNPVSRPITHWDATFDSALSGGGSKTWTLHIGESFTDVPTSHGFYSYIETMLHNGITKGCGTGTTYCPDSNVTRAQMAVFILRAEHGSGYAPPVCTVGFFADVVCTPIPGGFADFSQQLYVEGITKGCVTTPLSYCPDSNVTRAEMAVFLLRAEHGSGYIPPACAGIFTDVACTPIPAFAVTFIERLKNEGITSGCGTGTTYCPNSPATRGEMAVFLTRTFKMLLYGP